MSEEGNWQTLIRIVDTIEGVQTHREGGCVLLASSCMQLPPAAFVGTHFSSLADFKGDDAVAFDKSTQRLICSQFT